MDIQDNPKLLQLYRVVTLIASVLATSVVVYAGVVEFWLWREPGFAGFAAATELAWLRPALISIGVLAVLASGWLRGRLLGDGAGLGAMVSQVMLPQHRYQTMLRAAVVSLALCDFAAVSGLLLFLLSGQRLDFYGLAVVALFGIRVRFPSYHQWQMWYARRNSIR